MPQPHENVIPEAPLVALEDVCVHLAGRLVLERVSWNVRPGERWSITGGNGAGKSTLLKVAAGLLWPDAGCGLRQFCLPGSSPTESPLELRPNLTWVSPEDHQRRVRCAHGLPAGDVILSGWAGGDFPPRRVTSQMRARVAALAEGFGLTGVLGLRFERLSHGEQRRALLARAFLKPPLLLVLDEPLQGLDAANRGAALGALSALLRETPSLALCLATHRPEEECPAGMTHHLRLEAGKTFERHPAQPQAPNGACFKPDRECRETGALRTRSDAASQGASIITLRNVSVFSPDLEGSPPLLRDINWDFLEGEHWAVSGPSGAGKSTLLRLLYGELHAARGGKVLRFGKTLRELPMPRLRKLVSMVSPDIQIRYRANDRVEAVVASGLSAKLNDLPMPRGQALLRARAQLEALSLGDLEGRTLQTLSYGQARLVLLARALIAEPRLLLLDEPFDGLAPAARLAFSRHLDALASRKHLHLLVVTHHPEDLPQAINRVLRIEAGRIAGSGAPDPCNRRRRE